MSLEQCLPILLEHEGGYTNDPDDPGGPTNLGLTFIDMTNYGLPATVQQIQSLTPGSVLPIYKKLYWDPLMLDQVKDPNVQLILFDQGVLIGMSGITRIVQAIVGVNRDGIMGPATLAAINKVNAAELCSKFIQGCQEYFENRVENSPSLGKFLAGWENRLHDLVNRVA